MNKAVHDTTTVLQIPELHSSRKLKATDNSHPITCLSGGKAPGHSCAVRQGTRHIYALSAISATPLVFGSSLLHPADVPDERSVCVISKLLDVMDLAVILNLDVKFTICLAAGEAAEFHHLPFQVTSHDLAHCPYFEGQPCVTFAFSDMVRATVRPRRHC